MIEISIESPKRDYVIIKMKLTSKVFVLSILQTISTEDHVIDYYHLLNSTLTHISWL